MSAELEPRLQTYDQVKRSRKESFVKRHDTPWAVVDFVFWQSAIFSRQAMRLNHVQAHRYGDRKALGMFRIIATFIMLTLLAFSTVYDLLINLARPWLSLNFWVCLGTFVYFLLTLIDYQHYFSQKQPDQRKAADGSNPFYLWKQITLLNGFMFPAALHLVFLISYRRSEPLYAIDILLNFTPLLVLSFDWMLNRIYLNIYVVLLYPFFAYAFYFTYWEITRTPVTASPIPEMAIFKVWPVMLAYAFPLIASFAVYTGFTIKFLVLDEGDKLWGQKETMIIQRSNILQRREKPAKYSLQGKKDDYDSLFESPDEASLGEDNDDEDIIVEVNSDIDDLSQKKDRTTPRGNKALSTVGKSDRRSFTSYNESNDSNNDRVSRGGRGHQQYESNSSNNDQVSSYGGRDNDRISYGGGRSHQQLNKNDSESHHSESFMNNSDLASIREHEDDDCDDDETGRKRTAADGDYISLKARRMWGTQHGRWVGQVEGDEKKIKLKYIPNDKPAADNDNDVSQQSIQHAEDQI